MNQNCEHCEAKPKTSQEQYAKFGELAWNYITKSGQDFFENEISADIMPLAFQSGLCKQVAYDPELHGYLNYEPGTLIYWWGEEKDESNER